MTDVPGRDIERWREALRAGGHEAAGPRCPSTDAIWAAAAGESDAKQVEEIIDHTVDCGVCAQGWRLARAMALERAGAHAEAAAPSAAHETASIGWLKTLMPLAAVAVLVLAAGAAYQTGWFRADDAPVFRDASAPAVVDSLVGDGPLARDRFVLRWTAGPPDSRYNLTITAEDLTPIAEAAALADPEYTVATSELASLPDGATIIWQVETLTPDGRRIQSPAFLTRVE